MNIDNFSIQLQRFSSTIPIRLATGLRRIGLGISVDSYPQEWLTGLATTFISLGFYLATIPSTLSRFHFGGDGGELITASYTWGIPHPPGYPTYVVFGKLFSLIPFGTIWQRYQVFSAVCVAIAAGFAALTAARLIRTMNPDYVRGELITLAALSCGLFVAFAPLVWSQAVIAEVYALNIAILGIFIWAIITRRSAQTVGFLMGLSLTTHITSIFILPVALFSPSALPRKRFLLAVLVGLTPFLILPLLALTDSPIRWGEAKTAAGWLWLTTARLYSSNLMVINPDIWITRLRQLRPSIGLSLVLILIPTAIVLNRLFEETIVMTNLRSQKKKGINWLLTSLRKSPKQDQTEVAFDPRGQTPSRLAVLLLVATIPYFAFSMSYRPEDAIVMLLPVFLFLGLGLTYVNPRFFRLLPIPSLIMLILTVIFLGSAESDKSEASARALLAATPPDSVLLTSGDEIYSIMTYLIYVEGLRGDILLIDSNMYQFDWYRQQLKDLNGDLKRLRYDSLTDFISDNAAKIPICRISSSKDSLLCYGLSRFK